MLKICSSSIYPFQFLAYKIFTKKAKKLVDKAMYPLYTKTSRLREQRNELDSKIFCHIILRIYIVYLKLYHSLFVKTIWEIHNYGLQLDFCINAGLLQRYVVYVCATKGGINYGYT